MGACFDYNYFRIEKKFNLRKGAWQGVYDINKVRESFKRLQEMDRHENGYSYSGSIGMADGLLDKTNNVFKNHDEAAEWVLETAEKWGPAIAVRYVENDEQYIFIGAWCSS